MPVVFIEAPPGLRPDAKRRLVEKVTAAIAEATPLIFLREYPAEKVAMDGQRQSENPQDSRGLEADQLLSGAGRGSAADRGLTARRGSGHRVRCPRPPRSGECTIRTRRPWRRRTR